MGRYLLILFLLSVISAYSQSSDTIRIYLSPSGNDSNPGTMKYPKKSPEAARIQIQKIRKSEKIGKRYFEVIFGGGEYSLESTLVFGLDDSGDSNTKIVYKAISGSLARFSGGKKINAGDFKKVKDPELINRLTSEKAKQFILEYDLLAHGIYDFGNMKHHGFGWAVQNAPMELFINGIPAVLAQYPNNKGDFIRIKSIIDSGSVPRYGDFSNRGGIFTVDDPRIEKWKEADDFWIQGMFGTIWADDFLKVKKIDQFNQSIETVLPHLYGIRGGHFKAINLFEEIDTIGEYFIDRKKGKLYVYPGDDFLSGEIYLSMLENPFIAFENASNITFENLVFEYSRGLGIYIEGGENIQLKNCTIRNLGGMAVSIGMGVEADTMMGIGGNGKPASRIVGDIRRYIYSNILFDRKGGKNHKISGCKIYNLGAGGISLGGGNRSKLDTAGNTIENCEIFYVNRWEKTYRPLIDLSGVGNIIRHCSLHDATHSAILFTGNDHLIEYNDIFNTCSESNDVGVLYSGRDPSSYGTTIRYNYIHDNGPSELYFPHPYSQGIYLDDFNSGTTVLGNIFKNMKTSILASGWDTKIYNNIIVNSGPITFQLRYFNEVTKTRLYLVNPAFPPYSEHYPGLRMHLGKHEESGWAYGSEVYNNISFYKNKKCLIFDKIQEGAVVFMNNISIDEDPLLYNNNKIPIGIKPEYLKIVNTFSTLNFDNIGILKE